MAFSDLFSHRRGTRSNASHGEVYATRALGPFLTALSRRPDPVLLDLGPAIGTNVTFFGGEVGCKVVVEDLMRDVEAHAAADTLDALPAFLDSRIPQPPESVDGILCWDLFDYLDRPAATRLAAQLTRVLRPGGVLLALFALAAPASGRPQRTRHVVVDRTHIEYRASDGAQARRRPLVNRDIQRLFEPLRVTENFLLSTSVREVVFQKPAGATMPGDTPPAGG